MTKNLHSLRLRLERRLADFGDCLRLTAVMVNFLQNVAEKLSFVNRPNRPNSAVFRGTFVTVAGADIKLHFKEYSPHSGRVETRRESPRVAEIAIAISTAYSLRHPECARIGERGADVFLFGAGGIDQPRPPDYQRTASAEHGYTITCRRYFTTPAIPAHDAGESRIGAAGGQRR